MFVIPALFVLRVTWFLQPAFGYELISVREETIIHAETRGTGS
jgi:hypothetical protein